MEKSSIAKWKKTLVVIVAVILGLITLFIMFDNGVFSKMSSVKFDKTALQFVNTQIQVFDKDNKQINTDYLSTRQVITLNKVPEHVKQAFISVEDKNFYNHKGLNYKRILGATINNLKSMSFREGASTISQQLIKNTHLTSKKTISRKIDEMLLTQQLEKEFSKDEILQAYLNVIYFGSGTFGIEQASQKYFSKSASELTLEEGAVLAGIIKSPKTYSPLHNPQNCLARRNTVLKEMLKDGKISQEQYDTATAKPIELKLNDKALGNNSYINASIDEACNILNLSEKDLVIEGYKIYTYLNPNLQQSIEQTLDNLKVENNPDKLSLMIDSNNGAIVAYYGKSNYDLKQLKRQPGSAIKPVLVYAPAIENNLVTPYTPILDEPYKIDGYKPKNYQNKYKGWTNIETALATSLNIPAVKTLEYVGIEKAKNFGKKLGLTFDSKDNGYAIALGGFDKGITVEQLANSYLPLSNGGEYIKASFVHKIENKYGRVIYQNSNKKTKVIRDDTAYLMTNMLNKAVKEGTGRKLSDLNLAVACKTGTVGSQINGSNTDAYNIAYTPNYVVASWLGNTTGKLENNLTSSTNGANQPTLINKQILLKINDKDTFIKPDSIVTVPIDSMEYKENNIVKLASNNTPDRYKSYVEFAKSNLPKQTSTRFEQIESFDIKHKNYPDKVEIIVPSKSYLSYQIYKVTNGKTTLLKEYDNKEGEFVYIDNDIKNNQLYQYYVAARLKIDKGSISCDSNKITIYKTDNKKTISNNEIVWE